MKKIDVLLLKLFRYGGYMKTAFGIERIHVNSDDVDYNGGIFYATTESFNLRTLAFKDYGKTWALTKEKLEK